MVMAKASAVKAMAYENENEIINNQLIMAK
jgi:hypothetical protein